MITITIKADTGSMSPKISEPYNLCKLELTYIIILPARKGGLGSSVAREGSRLRGLI